LPAFDTVEVRSSNLRGAVIPKSLKKATSRAVSVRFALFYIEDRPRCRRPTYNVDPRKLRSICALLARLSLPRSGNEAVQAVLSALNPSCIMTLGRKDALVPE
jgi:hypothetical protein